MPKSINKKTKKPSLSILRLIVFWPPVAIALALALVTPAYLILRSFGAYNSFIELMFSAKTISIFLRTFILILLVTFFSLLIALPAAWLTERTDLPFRRTFRVLTSLPLVVPSYVFALILVMFLSPKGMLQDLLEPFGINKIPEIYGLPGAVLSLSLITFPYVLIPIRAYLARVDISAEEAARSLGYSGFNLFMSVTFPMLRPAIVAGSLLVALYTLSDFGAVALMRYETFTWSIFIQYQTTFNSPNAAVLSLILASFASVILIVFWIADKKREYYRSTPGADNIATLSKLGKWKPLSIFFMFSLVTMSLLLPLAILCYWVIRGVLAGERIDSLWAPAANSITVSALAAVLCVLIAVPLAYMSVRQKNRYATVIYQSTYIGFALPGITIALAFVFIVASYITPLYQTVVVLLFAYVTLFVSVTVGSIQASLRQVNPNLEEAASSLGRTPINILLSITVPLLWKGILAGGVLAFLLTMKELPVTLILSPIGFTSLATVIWSASEEAFFAKAAAPALLLVLLSSVPLAIFEVKRSKS